MHVKRLSFYSCSLRSQSIYLSIYYHHNVHHYHYQHSFKQLSCIDERNMQIYHQGSRSSNDIGQFLRAAGRFPRTRMLVVFISLQYMGQNIPCILQTLLLSDGGSKQTIDSQINHHVKIKITLHLYIFFLHTK
jgi:hypothetical protein